MLTEEARAFRRRVEDPANFLDTCDGGDPGSPEQPSIWLFGIEPGWGLADEEADKNPEPDPEAVERLKQYSIELQMPWNFNRNAFKLLAALEGSSPDDYQEFAERAQPFVRGSTGYLKGNLFPVPCNNVGKWTARSAEMTGFSDKAEYQSWVRASRLPILKDQVARYRPRLVIGSGLTHLTDFLTITGTHEPPQEHGFEVNGHAKRICTARTGTVPVAIIPHLSGGSNGLNSNLSIAKAAEFIKAELAV